LQTNTTIKKTKDRMKKLETKFMFGTHSLPYYFDPVTGIKKMKDNWDQNEAIKQIREKELTQEIIQSVS